MTKSPSDLQARHRFLPSALFESGLGLLAITLGFLVDIDPRQSIPDWNELGPIGYQCLIGIGFGIGLFGLMWLSGKIPHHRIRQMERNSHEVVCRLFLPLSGMEILVLCLSAGVGEELLFRGWLQSYLAVASWMSWTTEYQPWIAMVGSSLVFGLCHYLSFEYFLMASLMGLLLGGLFWWTGSLLVVIMAHAIYDWLIVREYLRRAQ